MWRTIHAIALSSEGKPLKSSEFKAFMLALSRVMPCDTCAAELADLLLSGDPSADLRPLDELEGDTSFAWTVALHNRINRNSGASEWTREKALDALVTTDSASDSQPHNPLFQNQLHHLIGPNALALGLAVGILVAAVIAGLFGLAASLMYMLLKRVRRMCTL
jgi:hypothetical protein